MRGLMALAVGAPTARQVLVLVAGQFGDVPLYSFQTGLTHGTVNTAARWVVAHSRIPTARYAEDPTMTHLDALWARPGDNALTDSVVPFLRQLDER